MYVVSTFCYIIPQNEQDYQIFITCCIIRLTIVIPHQQEAPTIIGFPPVFISCITLLFSPIAARQLNITQPAVSQHIHFLEEHYHTTLFQYRNKQLFLTRTGEILYKHLLTMKNDETAILEELNSTSSDIESLSIGVTMTIGEYAIVDKLAGFLIHHPEMNLHIHYGNTAQLLNLLDGGQIRLAIVEGNYTKTNYSHKKCNMILISSGKKIVFIPINTLRSCTFLHVQTPYSVSDGISDKGTVYDAYLSYTLF